MEAAPASAVGALLRPKKKKKMDGDEKQTAAKAAKKKDRVAHRASPDVQESRPLHEGFRPLRELEVDESRRRIKFVLLTEGLGNLKDKNYYGKESIESAVQVFEGAHAFVDHMTSAEEYERPEGSLEDLCGVWSECAVEAVPNEFGETVQGCTAWLNFDSSENGEQAYIKAKDAIRFREEGIKDDYIGVSINADGQTHPETVGDIEVNYVDRITAAASCDLVTRAGRGGRVLHETKKRGRGGARRFAPGRKAMSFKELAKKFKEALTKKTPPVIKTAADAKKFVESAAFKEMDLPGLKDFVGQIEKLVAKGQMGEEDGVGVVQKALDQVTAAPEEQDPDPGEEPGMEGDDDYPEKEGDDGEPKKEGDDDYPKKEQDDAGDKMKPKESGGRSSTHRSRKDDATLKENAALKKENRQLKIDNWTRRMRDVVAGQIREAGLPKGVVSIRRLLRECDMRLTPDQNKVRVDEAINEVKAIIESASPAEDDDNRPLIEGAGPRQSGDTGDGGSYVGKLLKETGVIVKSKKKDEPKDKE